MPVRSTRFAIGTILTTALAPDVILWTCPADRTDLVHRLSVFNQDNVAHVITLSIRSASLADWPNIVTLSLPGRGSYVDESRPVLVEGDRFYLSCSDTAAFQIHASGSRLLGDFQ